MKVLRDSRVWVPCRAISGRTGIRACVPEQRIGIREPVVYARIRFVFFSSFPPKQESRRTKNAIRMLIQMLETLTSSGDSRAIASH